MSTVSIVISFPCSPGASLGTFTPGNPVKTRDLLYRLMVSQLFYDGHQQVAVQLTNLIVSDPPCPPSERLLHVVTLGLEREAEAKKEKAINANDNVSDTDFRN